MPAALSDFVSKHMVGFLNLALRRRRYFVENAVKLEALQALKESENIDLVICTGDYTALGGLGEMRLARQMIEPLTKAPLGFVTLPGNHDVYTLKSAFEHRFEQFFGEFLHSDLPQYQVPGEHFPLVRLIGEDLAVIAINSAVPHWEAWRSDGYVSERQLECLKKMLSDATITPRYVIFAIHYGLFRQDGTPDHRHHGLKNADALLAVCRRFTPSMLIHGHLHHRFFLPSSHGGIPIFCAGSATHAGREGLWIYEITAGKCRAWPGSWTSDGYRLGAPIEVTAA